MDSRKVSQLNKLLSQLTDSILMAWNKNIHICGIFCDLTKAFACVNHDVLIVKLKLYGLQESPLN